MRLESITGKFQFRLVWRWQYVISNGDFDPELEFGFGSTVELLVDRRVVAVKSYVRSSTVREPLKEYVLMWGDGKKFSKLGSNN